MYKDFALRENVQVYLSFGLVIMENCLSLCYKFCILTYTRKLTQFSKEPVHEISNNVVCATSKALDQPVHTRSLIRAFVSHLSIL